MYYSFAFVFVLVIVINLLGKVTLQNLPSRNYGMPPNNPRDDIINIGNGSYRTNVVVLEDNPKSASSNQRGGSQYEGLGNRFGTGNTYRENRPNPRPKPDQYHHTQVNNNQNPQSSNSGRTQTQGSASYAKNNVGTSFMASQGTGLVNVGYRTDNHNQIVTNNRPIQPVAPMNSGGRTIETEASAHNLRNNGGTSFVSPDGTGVFHVGYGKDNHNQIFSNNRPIQPVEPLNSSGRTLQTQGSVYNARNNGGTPFVSPDVTGVFNDGYERDNHNQIFANNRPDQRTTPVNGGPRTTQTQSGKASNNGGYESRANINKVFVNGQPRQPDQNDGTWSTYYINNQRIQILNTGRAQSENKLNTLYGMLAQILQIKSQLKQEAESLNIKI